MQLGGTFSLASFYPTLLFFTCSTTLSPLLLFYSLLSFYLLPAQPPTPDPLPCELPMCHHLQILQLQTQTNLSDHWSTATSTPKQLLSPKSHPLKTYPTTQNQEWAIKNTRITELEHRKLNPKLNARKLNKSSLNQIRNWKIAHHNEYQNQWGSKGSWAPANKKSAIL